MLSTWILILVLFVVLTNCDDCKNPENGEILGNARQLPLTGIPIPTIPSVISQPLNALVLRSFQNWKMVMLRGNAANGIPILDPLVIPFSIPISFPNPFLGIGIFKLVLSQITFTGLSTFAIKNLNVQPSSLSFENYIGNMSASCSYALSYSLASFAPAVPINQGSAYGAIYGADLIGSGTLFPTPDNWFKLATIAMTFSFESLDIRVYPKIPLVDSNLQAQIQNLVYNEIQAMKPNMSQFSTMSYSKTVELNLT